MTRWIYSLCSEVVTTVPETLTHSMPSSLSSESNVAPMPASAPFGCFRLQLVDHFSATVLNLFLGGSAPATDDVPDPGDNVADDVRTDHCFA